MSKTQGTGNNAATTSGTSSQHAESSLFSPHLLAVLPVVLRAVQNPQVLAINCPSAADLKALSGLEVRQVTSDPARDGRRAGMEATYDLVICRPRTPAASVDVLQALMPALKPEAALFLVVPDAPSPAFWVHQVSSQGFQTHLGFAPARNGINVLGIRGGSRGAVKNRLKEQSPHLRVPESPHLHVVQKSTGQWGKAGLACGKECALYLCLDADCRRRFSLKLRFLPAGTLSAFSLDIVLNNRLVDRQVIHPDRQQVIECRDLLLLPGGNQLSFRPNVDIPVLPLASVAVTSVENADTDEANLAVPPDVYSRYRTIRHMVKSLKPTPKRRMSVLDVGGGDGWIHLFLGDMCDTYSLDQAAWDHPRHIQADFFDWPLAKNAYDVIVSADTLEHLPQSRRHAFLERLQQGAACAIILIAPVASPANQAAEELLANALHKEFSLTDAFLAEHKRFGLPDKHRLTRYFADHFAGSHLLQLVPVDRWLITILLDYYMTYEQYTFHEYSACNRFYNSTIAGKDIAAAQGYRLALAGVKPGFRITPPAPVADPCTHGDFAGFLASVLAALKEKNRSKRAYDELNLRYQYYLKAIAEHKDIVAELRQRLSEYQQENRVLRKDLEETRKENSYLQQELARHKQVVAAVNQDKDLLDQERKKLLADSGRYQQETAKLTDMLINYQQENDKLLAGLKAFEQENAQITATITRQDSHIAKLTGENKTLYAEIDKRSAEIQARQKDITGLLGTIEHQKNRITALQVALDDNEKILVIKEQKISQLHQAKDELQAEYQKLAKIKATIQASVNDLEKENSLYRLELEAIHDSFTYRFCQSIRKLLGRS